MRPPFCKYELIAPGVGPVAKERTLAGAMDAGARWLEAYPDEPHVVLADRKAKCGSADMFTTGRANHDPTKANGRRDLEGERGGGAVGDYTRKQQGDWRRDANHWARKEELGYYDSMGFFSGIIWYWPGGAIAARFHRTTLRSDIRKDVALVDQLNSISAEEKGSIREFARRSLGPFMQASGKASYRTFYFTEFFVVYASATIALAVAWAMYDVNEIVQMHASSIAIRVFAIIFLIVPLPLLPRLNRLVSRVVWRRDRQRMRRSCHFAGAAMTITAVAMFLFAPGHPRVENLLAAVYFAALLHVTLLVFMLVLSFRPLYRRVHILSATPDGALVHNLLMILEVLEAKTDLASLKVKESLTNRLEACAKCIELGISPTLRTGDSITDQMLRVRLALSAAAFRELKLWVLFPKSDTISQLRVRVACDLGVISTGRWDNLPQAVPRSLRKTGKELAIVVRSLSSAALPLGLILLIHHFGYLKDPQLLTWAVLIGCGWAALCLVFSVDPSFASKAETLRAAFQSIPQLRKGKE